MNALTTLEAKTDVLTMSSREIAELVEKRHDNVKRTIETLIEQGVIQRPQIEEVKNHLGQTVQEYRVGKRDSYVVVAQLSPQFTARLVDRWQELEEQVKRPAVTAEDLSKNPRLFAKVLLDYAETQEKLEEAVRTKAQIGSRREATAMATASKLSRENQRLKEEIGDGKQYKQVRAIPWIVGKYSVWGKKLKKQSDEMGYEVKRLEDSRYGEVNAYHIDVINALYRQEFSGVAHA